MAKKMVDECEYCGRMVTKSDIKIEKMISDDVMPCYCKIVRYVQDKDKLIKKLKKDITFFEMMMNVEDWDREGFYEVMIDNEEDEYFIKWYAKRFLKKESEAQE